MNLIQQYVKLMFILLICSYLVPNERYRRYVHFFIGIWVSTLLLKPCLTFLDSGEEILYKNRTQLEQ